jgi:RNA polymerase sigma-70 factor (ECF subfamily)
MPLASDGEMVGRIGRREEFDLLPARRPEEMRAQGSTKTNLETVPFPIEPSQMSDERLVGLVSADHSDALNELFSRHSKLVYGIALRILHDAGEAEEVVQECFLYVYRKAHSFEPSRGTAKVWIIQVAYSRARDRKSHLTRRGFYLRTDIESGGLEGTLAGNADVEREIGAKVDFGRLQCAFDDLTEVQSETLRMFYFDGMELKEISERLHAPLGNVRHHFYRGLERLRKSAVVERLRNHRHATN